MQTALQGASCTSGNILHWTTWLCTELPACTVFLPSEPALQRSSWVLSQPEGLKLSPSNQNCTSLTNQSGSILTNQNSAFWTKLGGFGVLICMVTDQSGTRDRTTVYISHLPLHSGSTLCLHFKDWRLCFPGWAETPKMAEQCSAEQTGTELSKSYQGTADQHRAEQSRGVGHPGPRAASQSQLSCFALNKVSVFIVP